MGQILAGEGFILLSEIDQSRQHLVYASKLACFQH